MLEFILALLDQDFSRKEGKKRSQQRWRPENDYSVATPPVHPAQSFAKICARIEGNDITLKCVEFRDEFFNVRRLAHALAVNQHITQLNLVASIRDRETRDSRPRSAPAHDILHLFMEGLRHNTSIIDLDISETTIRASGAIFVSRGLHDHPRLERLRLARCILQDEGVRRMGGAPLGKNLRELDLSGNGLSDGAAILGILRNNPFLVKLDLSNNSISAKGCEQLLVDGFLSLEVCDLSRNLIRRDTIQILGKALSSGGTKPCNLKELRLDANEFWDCSMESLAFGLVSNSSLERLYLSNNYISDLGVMKLAIALDLNKSHTRLRELYLSGNNIHTSGALALIHVKSLVKLDLSVNRITDGKGICDVIRNENVFSLKYLNVHRNPIPLYYTRLIRFWAGLNSSGGRQLLANSGDNKGGESLTKWPAVLARVSNDPNGLFYFLTRKPEICINASGCTSMRVCSLT
jgi:Leucine-rich repeat (LRR) protein